MNPRLKLVSLASTLQQAAMAAHAAYWLQSGTVYEEQLRELMERLNEAADLAGCQLVPKKEK